MALTRIRHPLGSAGAIREWAHNVSTAIEEGRLRLDSPGFSFRYLWERLVGHVEDTLYAAQRLQGYISLPIREAELAAIGTTSFKKVTGELISKHVVAAYEYGPQIAGELAETIPTRFRKEDFPAFTDVDTPEKVPEGSQYPETSFAEKYFGSKDVEKRGLVVAVTEEAVLFDQTGQVMERAKRIGEKAKYLREKAVVDLVQDYDPDGTANEVFAPQGAFEALYRTSAGTNSSTVNKKASNALAAYEDIEAAILLFPDMTDSAGEKIAMPSRFQILVPMALMQTATYIANPATVPLGWISNTQWTEQARGVRAWPIELPLSSVHMRDATTWYIGDFKKQFRVRQVWPIQTMTAQKHDMQFTHDIVAPYKVRWMDGVACIDDVYVVQCAA